MTLKNKNKNFFTLKKPPSKIKKINFRLQIFSNILIEKSVIKKFSVLPQTLKYYEVQKVFLSLHIREFCGVFCRQIP